MLRNDPQIRVAIDRFRTRAHEIRRLALATAVGEAQRDLLAVAIQYDVLADEAEYPTLH